MVVSTFQLSASNNATLQAPVIPPVAPVAWMRLRASASVVQAMDVPGELTRGRAAQVKVAAHLVMTNLPLTH